MCSKSSNAASCVQQSHPNLQNANFHQTKRAAAATCHPQLKYSPSVSFLLLRFYSVSTSILSLLFWLTETTPTQVSSVSVYHFLMPPLGVITNKNHVSQQCFRSCSRTDIGPPLPHATPEHPCPAVLGKLWVCVFNVWALLIVWQ